MKKDYIEKFNKSFILGEELEVSGSFVYDGLEYIKTLNIHDPKHNVELFLAYYHFAVGIERIAKILIKLSYEELKKTHNTYELLETLDVFNSFSDEEKELLKKLNIFYKNIRYIRLDMNNNDIVNNIQEFNLFDFPIDQIEKIVLSLFNKIYREIRSISIYNNFYTDGIRPESKTAMLINLSENGLF